MAELADAPDLGSVTTVEFFLRLSGRLKTTEIKYAGMVKLADTLDLGIVTTVEFSVAVGQVKNRQKI